jgi:hypothetical protein
MLRNKFLFSPLQMGSGYSGSVVVSSTAFQSQTSAAPHLQSGELKLKRISSLSFYFLLQTF